MPAIQKSFQGVVLIGLLLVLGSVGALYAATPPLAVPALGVSEPISYQALSLPKGVLHYVVIPLHSSYRVMPAASETLQSVEAFAQQYHSPMVINGGYFDPNNGKTTSFITLSGKLAGDPRQNERLMENPSLKSLMSQILNRTEFRVYQCPQGPQYDITPHLAPVPKGCQLEAALGAGPDLSDSQHLQAEAFVGYRDKKLVRDPLGAYRLNARSAVGLTKSGAVIIAMLAQPPEKPSQSGVTLPQLASLMQSLGACKMMALDGGSSSSLFVQGKAIYGKLNADGSSVRRNVKSVLLLQKF